MADALTAPLFKADGTEAGTVELNEAIFGIEPNTAVMHQVVTAQLAAKRAGTHSTKTRAEVRGGGAKPWRQKGLGRARHGSIRSPQWVGGGVAHGPKPRDYSQRTPKKMKRLALRSALSARAAENQIKVVETFEIWDEPKTKNAVALLEAMGVTGKVLLIAEDHERSAIKSFRNLDHVIASNLGQANTYDVLWADTIVMSKGTLDLGQGAPRGTEEHAAGVQAEAGDAA
jgi:large subunit ribosomal protein L4